MNISGELVGDDHDVHPPAVQADAEQAAEQVNPWEKALSPVADIFCPDTEYNTAVQAADNDPTIPQLDGHSSPAQTPSGQGYLSSLGLLDMIGRNKESEEAARKRERDQDLNCIKNLLGNF